MAGTSTTYDPYVSAGLSGAQNLITSQTSKPYTPYTSSAQNAPVQTQMFDYTANAPLQQINAPNYTLSAGAAPGFQGLMGGDYDALQSALQQPGQQQATNAYNTGLMNLNNAMGGRGLYGSSVMGQQQTQGLDREYMNALAANASQAAASRYGLQASDLKNKNDFGLNLYAQKLAEQKDLNAYEAQRTAGLMGQAMNTATVGAQNADSLNQYNNLRYNAQKEFNEQTNNWQNQQNYEKNFLYPQAKNTYEQAQQEQLINQYLALAGQGAPLATAASNAQLQEMQIAAQQAAAAQNSSAQLWGAGLNALGNIGGGLLSSASKQPLGTTFGNLFK